MKHGQKNIKLCFIMFVIKIDVSCVCGCLLSTFVYAGTLIWKRQEISMDP